MEIMDNNANQHETTNHNLVKMNYLEDRNFSSGLVDGVDIEGSIRGGNDRMLIVDDGYQSQIRGAGRQAVQLKMTRKYAQNKLSEERICVATYDCVGRSCKRGRGSDGQGRTSTLVGLNTSTVLLHRYLPNNAQRINT